MDLNQLISTVDKIKLLQEQVKKVKDEIATRQEDLSQANVAIIKLNVTLNGIQSEFDKTISELKGILG